MQSVCRHWCNDQSNADNHTATTTVEEWEKMWVVREQMVGKTTQVRLKRCGKKRKDSKTKNHLNKSTNFNGRHLRQSVRWMCMWSSQWNIVSGSKEQSQITPLSKDNIWPLSTITPKSMVSHQLKPIFNGISKRHHRPLTKWFSSALSSSFHFWAPNGSAWYTPPPSGPLYPFKPSALWIM